MKRYIHAFAMCQSMFCFLPFPCHVWDEDARDKMLLFLPVVGLEIGAIWALLGWLCRWMRLPALITGLLLAILPFLITGFIHLDGFMDVTDAVRSCRSLERRREILKDSHVGAFAVIGIALLMLTQFAFFASLRDEAIIRPLVLVPAVSRCCAALAVHTLPAMSTSQYARQMKNPGHTVYFILLLIGMTGAGFLLFGRYGLVNVGCIAGFLLALRKGYRSLEGMNGDISGYSLTYGELAAVIVLILL